MKDKLDLEIEIGTERYPLRVHRKITVKGLIDYLNSKKGAEINMDNTEACLMLPLDIPLERLLDEKEITIRIQTEPTEKLIEDR